jgi:aryl carrier-like protein
VRKEEVRRELRKRLPEYMVPGEMVMVREMPQTPNGKVDRRALEGMREERGGGRGLRGEEIEGGVGEEKEGPRNEIERELVEIWGEVLGRGEVGVRERFFEIGGHSLKATQVVSRVRERMGVEVGLRSLFESPTIAEMAVAILQHQADQMDSVEIDQVLAELDHLSEDEALIMLSEELGRTVESNE